MLAFGEKSHHLYFVYGADMNSTQIALRCYNPMAVAVARLPNYRIGFYGQSSKWGGGEETFVEASGEDLWGVVYRLSFYDGERLDRCHDVRLDGNGAYFLWPSEVTDGEGTSYPVLLYKRALLGIQEPPTDAYLAHIVSGAICNGLPADYVEQLRAIPTIPSEAGMPLNDPVQREISFGAACGSCG
ncbi:gamma-glutamylcyclotransferase family protein [Rhodopseudomonas palustris]|uniref:Gamma-glutamylcyclotransferase n=1 Tax=Rhodopseudomonas palustris (strain BisB18) TaxID=316056 RepID=Q20XD5_RHOPB